MQPSAFEGAPAVLSDALKRKRRRRPAWSPEEERMLAEQHVLHGNKWLLIAQSLPGRSAGEIKNIYNSTLRSRRTRKRSLLRAYLAALQRRQADDEDDEEGRRRALLEVLTAAELRRQPHGYGRRQHRQQQQHLSSALEGPQADSLNMTDSSTGFPPSAEGAGAGASGISLTTEAITAAAPAFHRQAVAMEGGGGGGGGGGVPSSCTDGVRHLAPRPQSPDATCFLACCSLSVPHAAMPGNSSGTSAVAAAAAAAAAATSPTAEPSSPTGRYNPAPSMTTTTTTTTTITATRTRTTTYRTTALAETDSPDAWQPPEPEPEPPLCWEWATRPLLQQETLLPAPAPAAAAATPVLAGPPAAAAPAAAAVEGACCPLGSWRKAATCSHAGCCRIACGGGGGGGGAMLTAARDIGGGGETCHLVGRHGHPRLLQGTAAAADTPPAAAGLETPRHSGQPSQLAPDDASAGAVGRPPLLPAEEAAGRDAQLGGQQAGRLRTPDARDPAGPAFCNHDTGNDDVDDGLGGLVDCRSPPDGRSPHPAGKARTPRLGVGAATASSAWAALPFPPSAVTAPPATTAPTARAEAVEAAAPIRGMMKGKQAGCVLLSRSSINSINSVSNGSSSLLDMMFYLYDNQGMHDNWGRSFMPRGNGHGGLPTSGA